MMKEVVFVGAGVIVVSAIYAVVRYRMAKREKDEAIEKVFLDEVSVGEIKNWFVGKLVDENQKGVVFYPTRENAARWNVKIPASSNVLIQIVYDTKQDKVTAYREIAFTELGEKLKALLDGNNGTLVIDK